MAQSPISPPDQAATGPRDDLLASKLTIPRIRPDRLARSRLLERLDQGMARELVLVCTPAGFGKTTLLADWATRANLPVAWLSLDPLDNDPARFWRYVVAALDRACGGLAEQVLPQLTGPGGLSSQGMVTALLSQLEAPGAELALVVDDYHLLNAGPIHDGVAFLLRHLPPRLHLVIAGRSDPPLPLARLRAAGQLVELRAADLRFTHEEAAAFLRQVWRLDLSPQVVAAVEARTEGWAVGLQLAALSLRERPDPEAFVEEFTGSHRYVLDYLSEELLERQPEQVREFLLESSVLERLCGPLCDAVTGRTDSQQLLERIERANLFLLPLDEVRGWWRYHHLFADLLRVRLAQQQPERVVELHRAAAAWCETHRLVDDAIRHALAANDPAWAARLVERHLDQTLRRGERVTLRRHLEALPAEVVRSRPGLILAQALLEVHRGRPDAAERLLRHADRAVDRQPDPEQPKLPTEGGMVSRVPAATALVRAQLAAVRGDPEQTARFARSAVAHLSEGEVGPRLWARYLLAVADWLAGRVEQAELAFAEVLAEGRATAEPHPLLSACLYLGEVQRAQGRLGAALATYQEGLELAAQGGQPSTFHAADAHVGLGQVLYERNQLDEARQHLTDGLALPRPLGWPQLSGRALVTMAWIGQATGDPDGALQTMSEACRLMPGTQTPTWYHPAPAERARLLLAQGQVDQAARWAEAQGLTAEDEPSYLRERDHLVLARVLLALQQPERAGGLLERLDALAGSQGRTGSLIEIRALRSLALQATGDHQGALTLLAEALALARQERYVRVFSDEGPPMAALLRSLIGARQRGRAATGSGAATEHLYQVIQAFPPAKAPAGETIPVPAGLVEPLTERELEVLRLLAAGHRNRDIAQDLVVTQERSKSTSATSSTSSARPTAPKPSPTPASWASSPDTLTARTQTATIDLGTGDGRYVLATAAAQPDRLVVGVDANAAGMATASRRAAVKPLRGGLPNAVFVVAAAEALPAKLDGMADLVTRPLPLGVAATRPVGGRPAYHDGLDPAAVPWPSRTPPGVWPSPRRGRRPPPMSPPPTRPGASVSVPAPGRLPGCCALGCIAGSRHPPVGCPAAVVGPEAGLSRWSVGEPWVACRSADDFRSSPAMMAEPMAVLSSSQRSAERRSVWRCADGGGGRDLAGRAAAADQREVADLPTGCAAATGRRDGLRAGETGRRGAARRHPPLGSRLRQPRPRAGGGAGRIRRPPLGLAGRPGAGDPRPRGRRRRRRDPSAAARTGRPGGDQPTGLRLVLPLAGRGRLPTGGGPACADRRRVGAGPGRHPGRVPGRRPRPPAVLTAQPHRHRPRSPGSGAAGGAGGSPRRHRAGRRDPRAAGAARPDPSSVRVGVAGGGSARPGLHLGEQGVEPGRAEVRGGRHR
jgi:LuxR family maltose regulon positive regulatory protein